MTQNFNNKRVKKPYLTIRGCQSQRKVSENKISFKVREKSGRFVSGQGISKYLFKVSEKSGSFILRFSQIILLFNYLFIKLSKSSCRVIENCFTVRPGADLGEGDDLRLSNTNGILQKNVCGLLVLVAPFLSSASLLTKLLDPPLQLKS